MTCLSYKSGDCVESTTTYFAELHNCMIIVKNVPCLKCSQCEEVTFNNSVAKKLYELMQQADALANELTIIDYATKVA